MSALAWLLPLSYLLGSVSGSLLLGRWRGIDIRGHGSGNAGGTNALRTLGWRFALAVVAIDIGKGALAGWLGWGFAAPGLAPQASALACVGAAVLGHTWPLFFGFRGGKGAGTLVGGLLVAWPLSVPVLVALWLLVLTGTGYVGLATVLAAASLPLLAWLQPVAGDAGLARAVFAIAAMAFIVFTHRGNLQRLRAGREHRFDRARIWRRPARP